MMRNLAASLIEHEVIKTTVEKGKELRRFVEPLITRAKVDTLHNRRQIISQLNSKSATSKLFSNLGPRFNETKGGYLRVIKAGFREGDKADMCYVELTIRDLEQESKVDDAIVDENLVMPVDEVPETKTDEKTETAPEEVKAFTSSGAVSVFSSVLVSGTSSTGITKFSSTIASSTFDSCSKSRIVNST